MSCVTLLEHSVLRWGLTKYTDKNTLTFPQTVQNVIRFLVFFSDIASKRTQFDNGEVFNSKKEIKN